MVVMMDQDKPTVTDLRRWRLFTDHGDHQWKYLSNSETGCHKEQTDAEKYLLGISLDESVSEDGTTPATCTTRARKSAVRPESFADSAGRGFSFFQRLQLSEGHWACSYGGPSFLLPGLIFAAYITETPIPDEWVLEITRYLRHHVNDDGGWGLHLEGHSTVLATGLYYVMLRLLGLDQDVPLVAKARRCLLNLGGAAGIPQWGKIWLACLNLYDWDGVNCIPVDLWLLPPWLFFHPSRWWVQCRVVYLPTSYLWSNKCSIPLTPLLSQIREEIYTQPYEAINFSQQQNNTAPSDAIRKISPFMLVAFVMIGFWCHYLRPCWLLEKANRRVSELMQREEANTDFNCIAPVNKAFHMAAAWFEEGPQSERLRRHREKVDVYLWLGPHGMTCNGTNGVQVWDTAFAIQAAFESGLFNRPRYRDTLSKAHEFLAKSQLDDNLADPFRQPRRGGWPFSTKSNGYIVSDCAAESLKAVLLLQKESDFPQLIPDRRLTDCVDSLLPMQNGDGGFGSYEKARGSPYLELLNPAEVFDRIMVEYSYPECTTAVLTSLCLFRKHFPDYRSEDLKTCIGKALGFIKGSQRPDGSWDGAWAICFTYATFFAVQSLGAHGEQYINSAPVRKACEFLLAKQMEDGGWGEHYSSCVKRQYVHHESSQVVNTAWAVMALIHAGYPDPLPIQRGLKLIQSRQAASGEWLQEAVEGVFNQTCMIEYPNYKLYFTVMALGAYEHVYLPKIRPQRQKGADVAGAYSEGISLTDHRSSQ